MNKEKIKEFIHKQFGEDYMIEEVYFENQLCAIKLFKAAVEGEEDDGKTIVIWDGNIVNELTDNESIWEFEMSVLADKLKKKEDIEDMVDLIQYFLEKRDDKC